MTNRLAILTLESRDYLRGTVSVHLIGSLFSGFNTGIDLVEFSNGKMSVRMVNNFLFDKTHSFGLAMVAN